MKKILIIGAGFLQHYVIKKAREMGYYTIAVDADPNAIGFQYADKYAVIDIVDEKSCLKYALTEQVDGVLTAATDYGVLTTSYIAEKMGLPGIDYETAKLIKNKYLVKKRLQEYHVDDIDQSCKVTLGTNIKDLSTKIKYPIMVKPCDGSGSRGISKVDQPEELMKACKYAMSCSITNCAEIESFIDGKEYGAESLVVDGKVYVLSIIKKWMTRPPYYAELGHAIPSGLSISLENKVKRYVEKAINVLGINHGSVNMDLLITDNEEIHIIDVGARMGGNQIGSYLIPLGTGIDYMGNMLRLSVNDPIDWTLKEHGAVATKLLQLKPGIVKALPDFEISEDIIVEHHIHVGDVIKEYHTNLDGFGYVIAKAKKVTIAEKKADKARKWIDENIVREKCIK